MALGAWSLHPLLARGFYARGNTWFPTLLGTVVTVTVIPLYIAMRHWAGTNDLAAASSIALIAYVVPLHLMLRRAVRKDAGPGPELPRFRGFLAPSVAALAATIVTLYALRYGVESAFPGTSTALALVRIAVVAVAGVPVFLVSARLLGVEEAQALLVRISGVVARLRRRRGA